MALLKNQDVAYNLGMIEVFELIKQQKCFMVSTFDYKSQRFTFRVPYKLDYKFDGQYYCHENEELDIFVREAGVGEFIISFYEYFYVLWKEYAEADDKDLYGDALGLKKLLLNMCEVTK